MSPREMADELIRLLREKHPEMRSTHEAKPGAIGVWFMVDDQPVEFWIDVTAV